jgi:hypothetical protein
MLDQEAAGAPRREDDPELRRAQVAAFLIAAGGEG